MKFLVLALATLFSTPAFALDLITLDGKSTQVESLHRSHMWTLVMLWSLDCAACEQQKPMIEKFHKAHRLSNAQVIGIATDGDAKSKTIQTFVAEQPYSFKNYLARTKSFESEFQLETSTAFLGTPTYLLYAPGGKLAGTHTGTLRLEQLESIVGPAEELASPSTDIIQ